MQGQIAKHRDTLAYHKFINGSEYIHVSVPSMPVNYHVFKFKMKKDNKLKVVLANNRLPDFARKTIDEVSERESHSNNQVIGAINGDFFSYKNGELEGFQVSNNQIIYAHDSKIKFGVNIDKRNRISLDSVYFKGQLKTKNAKYSITGVNTFKYNAAKESIVLYDSHMSFDSIQPKNHSLVLIEKRGKRYRFIKKLDTLPSILSDNNFVLALNRANVENIIMQLKQQKSFKIDLDLVNNKTKKELKLANHISGGVPLVVNGVNVSSDLSENSDSYRNKVHPRTAIGINSIDNSVVWIVVDGRSDVSRGVNYRELAQLFIENNSTDALNLDGGGSSALWLYGDIKNVPSDKNGARPCLNYLLLSN